MAGGDERALAFPENLIEVATTVFDVVAAPVHTPLVAHAQKVGCTTISGAEVIVLQAVEQFVLYTGIRPPADAVEAAARFALSIPEEISLRAFSKLEPSLSSC